MNTESKHIRTLIDLEADRFFDWEGCSNQAIVTTTSAKLFAEHIAKLYCAQQDKRIDDLERAIKDTLEENGHLADGDNCTLITLKRAVNWSCHE